MSRILIRSIPELRTPFITNRFPGAFPRASCALLSTTSKLLAQSPDPARPSPSSPTSTPPGAPMGSIANPSSRFQKSRKTAPVAPPPAEAAESVAHLFPLLRAQPNHYITAHIHGLPYLVTQGDQIRLPFRMPDVLPGDVLRLDKASILGSRDYTLKGAPYIDSALFECRATVLGTESEPLRVKIKTKRRNRRSQRVTSKHKYTILRISELKLLGPAA